MTAFARSTDSTKQSASLPEADAAEQRECVPAVGSATDPGEEPPTGSVQSDSSHAENDEPELLKPQHVIVEILEPRKVRRDERSERVSEGSNGATESKHSSPKPSTASTPSSQEDVVLDLRKSAKRQKLYSSMPTQTTSSTPEEQVWSFDEMVKQREQYFEEEVEYERQRKTTRLKVPKACSTSTDDSTLGADNDIAAAALQRVLKKEDFKRMEVLGQFNLGFIIGKLDNDLFIIDQHASDEKFNYETLQQTTVMHQQPLVRPLMLELTAGEEMLILDHLDVFAKNGFTFLVDKDAPTTRKLKLLSLPFTKHTQFGTEGMLCGFKRALMLDADPCNRCAVRYPRAGVTADGRAVESVSHSVAESDGDVCIESVQKLDHDRNCAPQGGNAKSTLCIHARIEAASGRR
jgi:DNA mismatch repair ATPase MutL